VGLHEFKAPTPSDQRSPCPFLNSLANHGYLNRDGRGNTLYDLVKAQVEVFNFSVPLAATLSLGGLFLAGNGLYVDLEQLRVHDWYTIEHDASLGRQDIRTGENWIIDAKLVHAMIAEASSKDGVSMEDLARVRVHREATLPLPLDNLHVGVAIRESCLIVAQLGKGSPNDRTKRIIKPDWIKSFFIDERFPDDWTKPEQKLGFRDASAMGEVMKGEMAAYRASLKTK